MLVIIKGGIIPTSGRCPMAQTLGQFKVCFFVVLYNNFVISLYDYIMSFTYQITENLISDAIDVLYCNNYLNSTVAT